MAFVALSYIFGFVAQRVIQTVADLKKIAAGKWHYRNIQKEKRPNQKNIVREELTETLMEGMTTVRCRSCRSSNINRQGRKITI